MTSKDVQVKITTEWMQDHVHEKMQEVMQEVEDRVGGGSDRSMAALLLQAYAGLDVGSDHGADTPKRFLDMLGDLTKCRPIGLQDHDKSHIENCIKWKVFPSESDEMITVGPIDFVSVCNHHVLPFHGKAWIGYVPNLYIPGLSKPARVVRHFARRLQIQETLTAQIANFLESHLDPKGVAVHIMAEHTCMTFRGVQSPGTLTATTATQGVFADHSRTAKAEFLATVERMK